MNKNKYEKGCVCLFDKEGRHWIKGNCIIHSGKKDFVCGNCSDGSHLGSTSGEILPSQGILLKGGSYVSYRTCSGSRTESMRWHGH